MITQKVGYIRVSSVEQNTERQLREIKLDKVFTEKMSAKSIKKRAVLHDCIDYLRDGDILFIHSIDRLARNLLDLQNVIQQINAKGATVEFVSERLTFSNKEDPFALLTMQMLGAFAEFERKLINIRQREGMAIAKAKGKHIGRPALCDSVTENIQNMLKQGIPKAQIAKELNISRQSIYRILNKNKDD